MTVRTLRAQVHDLLEPDDDRSLTWASALIVALVLVSLGTLAIETEATRTDSPMPPWVAEAVVWINNVIVLLFAGEYALRTWSAQEKPAYAGPLGMARHAATPLAVFDLLAFAPELLAMIFLPHEGGAWLAGLRALRLFRLFKLARYVPAFEIVGNAVRRAGAPLLAAACVAAAQVYVAALMLYFIEGDIPGQEQSFGSVTRALWWAVVTLTTVGYGDVYPVTPLGRVAAALVALAGIGIVAMPTGILASSFAEEFREREARKRKAEAEDATAADAADKE
ncbi:MAG: ion transporter [Alphaproteobacteria bacterium]|nr:ion transporter [Alphaproteobacteria bacterium]